MNPEDTHYFGFSIPERAFVSTKNFVARSTIVPGDLVLLTADPIGAFIREGTAETPGKALRATSLALTVSRFREFRYIGTKFSLVPAASTAEVDPAHISESSGGTSNYMHPKDTGNFLHWRRWIGGNFPVPTVSPTGENGTYTEDDALDLDVAYMSDDAFNHVPLGQGFGGESEPLMAEVNTGALMSKSVFGVWEAENFGGKEALSVESGEQDLGQLMLTAGSVKPRGWMPNPFAGFRYSVDNRDIISGDIIDPLGGDSSFYVSGINPLFPWFADRVMANSDMVASHIYNLVRHNMLNPLVLIRFPPAYGSRYYWTFYMRHYFAVRGPYLVNEMFQVGKVQKYDTGNNAIKVGMPGVPVNVATLSDPDFSVCSFGKIRQFKSADPFDYLEGQDILSLDPELTAIQMKDKVVDDITQVRIDQKSDTDQKKEAKKVNTSDCVNEQQRFDDFPPRVKQWMTGYEKGVKE